MVRTRIAPAPSGDLHIGNARTALFNYLFTRKMGGQFVLRIDDTDAERTGVGIDSIVSIFTWLGLEFDEGPHIGGNHGPYVQSSRTKIYDAHASRLLAGGKAYECFCTKEELNARKQELMRQGTDNPKYDGRCKLLSAEEKDALRLTREPSLRFAVPKTSVHINDLLLGNIEIDTKDIGDTIIRRPNRGYTYPFATVIDDATLEMTHIIRGIDLWPNTPFQVLLYNAFGYQPPTFAHLPLVLNENGEKLSKRDKSSSLLFYKEQGYLPEALINYMALLGWNPNAGAHKSEVLTKDELISGFDITQVAENNARMDMKKLDFLNKTHMKRLGTQRFIELARQYIAPGCNISNDAAELVRDRVTKLSEVPVILAPYINDEFPFDNEAMQYLARDYIPKMFSGLVAKIPDKFSIDEIKKVFYAESQASGLKGKDFYWPVRAALIGTCSGPELERIAIAIGRDKLIDRLKKYSM